MALYFCWWSSRPSFLVDASTEARAVEMATGKAGKIGAPERVTLLPVDVFACDLFFDIDGAEPGDEEDDGPYTAEVLDHVLDVLQAIDDNDGALPAPPQRCGSQAASGGAVVQCLRDSGHEGAHRAPGVQWGAT